ncbi:MAG: hypothetical protein KJN84_12165 [Bacteroidia bacterium]|nr:hypothetical protein [Bacteroidia bacterium]
MKDLKFHIERLENQEDIPYDLLKEIQGIEKDYFIDNYKQPIFENGIQCKHLIILVKRL